MAFEVKEEFTEQWFGSEWGVFVDGKDVHSASTPFPRIRCYLWVLFHPAVW
jgi:hypothetical protein